MVIGFVFTFTYAGTFVPKTQPAGISAENRETLFKERMKWKREQIKIALKEGLIGEEEAKKWEEHFSYIDKFHKDNGFVPGCYGLEIGTRHDERIRHEFGKKIRSGYGRRAMGVNRWNR